MPRLKQTSVDTEVTGVDLYHGAKPFLVTWFDDEDESPSFFEWDVDPLTREPQIPKGDLKELTALLNRPREWLFQNPKFDITVLDSIDVWDHVDVGVFWKRVKDTLCAGHVLASNQPHDLTTMVLVYLKINIQPLEDAIKLATNKALAIAKKEFPDWLIAAEGLPMMPSAKRGKTKKDKRGLEFESMWKYDMWLPRAVAKEKGYPLDHPWWTVCSDYATGDSGVTKPLFQRMEQLLKDRKLWPIYLNRIATLPIAWGMERRGVTVSGDNLDEKDVEFKADSVKKRAACTSIANDYGYDLELPKNGVNNSLKTFVFDVMKLPVVGTTDTGQPSLDKYAMEEYEATLDNGPQLSFIKSLRASRKCDTALTYLAGYRRYMQPWTPVKIVNKKTGAGWYVLHPSLNPTGTDTLRWSSSNPNEQNISKQEGYNLRYCFGPVPGREWWSCDAKNIELRLPAYESGEQELIALFEQPDVPPYYGSTHLLNFHTVYEDLWEKELGSICNERKCCNGKRVTFETVGPHCKKKFASTWYQWCKNGGFAVQYGAIEGTLLRTGTADLAFHRQGAHAKLKSRFSKLETLNQYWIDFAKRCGYVETMPDKSVDPLRGYPLLVSRTSWGGVLETVPLNYHVQGTAMWWTMQAMIRCQRYLDDLNESRGVKPYEISDDGYYMTMQVHDELVFDFPKGSGPEPWRANLPVIKHIMGLMEVGGENLGVPTPAGAEYHANNWMEGYTISSKDLKEAA